MADEHPSLTQISKASHQLRMASYTAEGIDFAGGYIPDHVSAVHRRLLMDYLRQAARELGLDLVPLKGLCVGPAPSAT